MPTTVVLIGEATSAFISPLKKQYTTHTVRSGKQGILAATETNADVIILDTLSLGTNGIRICKAVRQALPNIFVIHIRTGMKNNGHTGADIVLSPPVSSRALINTVEHLLSRQNSFVLGCGPFALDCERHILRVHDEEVTLTPKQAALVEIFLNHPNETLDRKWLMQEVWNTDYTGDTRTLSVHVRFVREVMEPDPGKPRYLKTVRGVGYRLEIPD